MRGLILPPDAAAGQGTLYLLNEIRNRTNEEWCLVPPPLAGTAGKREGVAIFYKPATLTFTGPWVYSLAESGAKLRLPPTSENLSYLQDYTRSYATRFPTVKRTWNVGAKVVPESQGAAQTEFGNLKFPGDDDRPPTHVRMLDTAGRTLKIFAVHTSPSEAGPATRCIARIPELRTVNANEVSVVVGDFNVDSFADVDPDKDPYYRLRDPDGMQYDMLLKARMTATGPVVDARQPYCMTHLLPNTKPTGNITYKIIATPYNGTTGPISPRNSVYPRLGYMGSSWPSLNDKGTLDNAFVKYGANLVAPPHHTTIANTVAGQPYTAVAPPLGVTADLTSGRPQPHDLIMWAPAMVSTGFPFNANVSNFNDWDAYQHIYDTSDHLALIFDV